MKNIFLLFTTAFVFLFCTTCKKTSPAKVLPPITQTGASTFGCKINGQVWVPYYPCNDASWNGAVELAYSFNSANKNSVLPMSFGINAENFKDKNSLHIGTIGTLYGTGNIIDTLYIDFLANSGVYSNCIGCPESNSHMFKITKLDTVAKIISGTFSFTLYGSSDSIVITDGRFDLQIGQYSHCTN